LFFVFLFFLFFFFVLFLDFFFFLIPLATLSAQKVQAEKSAAALSLMMVCSSNKANDRIKSMETSLAQTSLHANVLCTLNVDYFTRVLELEKALKDKDEDMEELKGQLCMTEAERMKAQERHSRLRQAEELIPILVARMSPPSLFTSLLTFHLELNEMSQKRHDDKKAKESLQTETQEPLQATSNECTNSGDEVSFYLFLFHICHLVR
jgi:hypothetical protein